MRGDKFTHNYGESYSLSLLISYPTKQKIMTSFNHSIISPGTNNPKTPYRPPNKSLNRPKLIIWDYGIAYQTSDYKGLL